LGLGLVFLSSLRRKDSMKGLLDMSLFLIRLPRYEKKQTSPEKNLKELLAPSEQFYANLLSLFKRSFLEKLLYGPVRFAFEISSVYGEEEVGFYIACPKEFEVQIKKNIQGLYPAADIRKLPEDYNIFIPGGKAVAANLKLRKSPLWPLNTYLQLEADPLSQISNALSRLGKNQGAAFQLVLTQAPASFQSFGSRVVGYMSEGKNFKEAAFLARKRGLARILSEGLKRKEEEGKSNQKVDEKGIELVRSKIQKPVFKVNLRLIGSAPSEAAAWDILSHLESTFGQFSSPLANSLKSVRKKGARARKQILNFIFRAFDNKTSILLNSEEIVSLFHPPFSHLKTPKLKQVKAGETSIPENLPEKGVLEIGEAVFRGEKKKVFFASRKDRRRHLYIIGQTGTGKSTLILRMIVQDIRNGEGVGVIDPHGDLVEAVLERIPKERAEDLILFEPFDMERPLGINMLEFSNAKERDFAVSEMIAIFHKLFPPEIIGPMFEHYMRNAMLVLMSEQGNPGTLVEIPRVFTDEAFLKAKLLHVRDPLVRSFWEKEWRQTTGQTRSDMLGYVVSKIGRFVENEMMRNIIGQTTSSFDIDKIIKGRKIFLANLSKGRIGEINGSLLGLIIVSKLQMAAMRQGDLPQEKRQDFYLYMDEFQNFTTETIASILSEARKYRLNLIVAHQFIKQLDERIRNAVFGNIGSIVALRVGSEDGEFLEKQFEPEFSRYDLINLDNFNAIAKIMIEGVASIPFKMHTLPAEKGNPRIVEPLKKIAKLKYGRPKEFVEQEISQRAKLA